MIYATRLSKSFIEKYKEKKVPWGPLGYITYKRTYARQIDNRTEEWSETIERCVNSILDLNGRLTNEEAEKLFDHVFNLRCSFSGRSLWQLGTNTVAKFGGDSLVNCWNVNVNEPILPFCFAFDELMLGGGVGFNITPESVYSLPLVNFNPKIERVNNNDVDFIVPDNREGWIKLLKEVLTSFFYTGKNLTYSTSCIRPKGQPIKSFGGLASGSEELVKGINQITKIISNRYEQKLRPIDCLDIMNIIASIVVSGNVRRSAQLALGSPLDMDFINAKNWSQYNVPTWRAMSNNSVACNDINELPLEFWEAYNGNGEAYGLVNLQTCKNYGRLSDEIGYREDKNICGMNPCGEVALESYEPCNLAEIFLPNIQYLKQFIEISGLIYKVCKTISNLQFSHSETQAIVQKNRRIGISLTGFMQSNFRYDVETFNVVYQYLEALDKIYSQEIRSNESIKLTTIKPSGTLSLLAGVTSGMHPAFAPFYIRRMRMAANDPLVEFCKNHGYYIEPQLNQDGTINLETMVISFPIKTPMNAICAMELSAIDQLETQRWLQTFWSDNSVSTTIYYDIDEINNIKYWLSKNYTSVKACSFLLHSEHGFVQAPLEEITEEKYNELSLDKIEYNEIQDIIPNNDYLDNLECSKQTCPIK